MDQVVSLEPRDFSRVSVSDFIIFLYFNDVGEIV